MLKRIVTLLIAFQVLVFVAPSFASAEQRQATSRPAGQMIFAQASKDQCRAACTNQMMRCRANCAQGANYETCRSRCSSGGQACQDRC